MELTNKALALILVVAISISLVGTFLTLDRISNMQPIHVFTGRATTDTGTSNFTINSTLSVAFTTNSVEFGSGIVNSSGLHNCTLNTTGPGMLNGAANPVSGPDCIGFNATIEPLRIQNQGTQNVTLNISFNATGAAFITGTTPTLSFRATWNDTGACGNISNNTLISAMTPVTVADTNFSICNSTAFGWTSGNRTLNLDLGIKIPQDATAGVKRITITAYASSP